MRILIPSSLTRGLVVAALVLVATACASGGGRSRPATSAPPPAADAASPLEGEYHDAAGRRFTPRHRLPPLRSFLEHREGRTAPDEPVARPPRTVVADFTAKAQAGGRVRLRAVGGVGPERLTDDAANMAAAA
jgi:hypothetical protein